MNIYKCTNLLSGFLNSSSRKRIDRILFVLANGINPVTRICKIELLLEPSNLLRCQVSLKSLSWIGAGTICRETDHSADPIKFHQVTMVILPKGPEIFHNCKYSIGIKLRDTFWKENKKRVKELNCCLVKNQYSGFLLGLPLYLVCRQGQWVKYRSKLSIKNSTF